MTASQRLTLACIAAALAACSATPPANPVLDQARKDFRQAQALPESERLASLELKQAADALGLANDASTRGDKPEAVTHLAYLAKQRAAIARETVGQKSAEATVADADQARDRVRLDARTKEADTSQREADSSQRQADASRRETKAAQQATSDVQAENARLEAELKQLNAKKTDRGLVITLGDVLFDTNRSQLKFGGQRAVEQLAAFMQQHPERKAVIEGFTDSVGSEQHNQALSERRASAVRDAMATRGVDGGRLDAQGFGEEHPVGDNATASGRQLNRRVEIVVSDAQGAIPPR